jgi:hypothetical protein
MDDSIGESNINEAILVKCEDWEVLYINDKSVEEGHTLNQGRDRIKYFLNLTKKYNFKLDEMRIYYYNPRNDEADFTHDFKRMKHCFDTGEMYESK